MKKIAITLVALLATASLQAQETFVETYQEVMKHSAVKLLSRSDYQDRPDFPTTYCKFTEFQIPARNESLVSRLEQAILSEQDSAFSFFVKRPDASKLAQNNMKRYVYGPNNEFAVLFGSQKSHYYYGACFKEPTDSLSRHAYLFVWFKEGKSFHCYYYHIYGKNPNFVESRKPTKKISEQRTGSRRATLSGNSLVVEEYDGNGQLKSIRSELVSDAGQQITNDVEFMTQFGLLRVTLLDAIKDADQKMLQVGIAGKMVTLCKDHSKLLTAVERQTCKKTLTDLRATVGKTLPDTFLDGMLLQAATYLGTD